MLVTRSLCALQTLALIGKVDFPAHSLEKFFSIISTPSLKTMPQKISVVYKPRINPAMALEKLWALFQYFPHKGEKSE